MTMVTTNSPACPLIFCTALSPLSISQLGLSFQSNLRYSFSLSKRSGIVSCGGSSTPRTLDGSSARIGSVVPVVLRSRRPSGSFLCSGSGPPSVTRRAIVVGSLPVSWIAAGLVGIAATGGLAMAAMTAGQGDRQQAQLATRKGMELFSQGDVKGSLEKFNEALELDPPSLPYLWQRGLSLYYMDQFEEGAKQFRDDVAVNPNDTEEAIWCFLCEAQYLGVEEARQLFLVVGPDRRPIMRETYNLFRYGGSTDELLQKVGTTEGADYFYANLYAGLYHEANKREDAAKEAVLTAVDSFYGTRSGDYMAILARVHAKCRGWRVSLAPHV